MESTKRKLGNLNFALLNQKKTHLNITQKSMPATNERTIISENKYFVIQSFKKILPYQKIHRGNPGSQKT